MFRCDGESKRRSLEEIENGVCCRKESVGLGLSNELPPVHKLSTGRYLSEGDVLDLTGKSGHVRYREAA